MKKCTKCHTEKPLGDFARHKRDGFQYWCKQCTVDYNRTKMKAYTHRYLAEYRKSPEYRIKQNNHMRAWESMPENQIKIRAKYKVSRAIKSGKLVRQPCTQCGYKPAEAHHPNYEKPLDVIWLCKSHHELLHEELNRK